MAIETTFVFGKLRNIRKRCVSLAHVFPVRSGKFMTRVARRFLGINVSAMGKLRVVDRGLRGAELLRGAPALRWCNRIFAAAGLYVDAQHKQQCDDEGRRR
jgi:hypothetical protein